MPRITIEHSEFQARPSGILPASIIDILYHPRGDEAIPNMKHLKAENVSGVFEFQLMPEGHERSQTIWVPFAQVFKDGEIYLKESRGVSEINGIMEGLGLSIAGFSSDGSFVNEKDEVVQEADICMYVVEEVMQRPDFRVLVHVYKEKQSDGKSYFRTGLRFYPNTERGKEWAEKAAKDELEWQATREATMAQRSPMAGTEPTPATTPRKRL